MCSFKIKSIILSFGLIFAISIDAKMIRDSSVTDSQVIFDTASNLMWQDDNDPDLLTHTWIDGISYCENLDKKSYTNWRLPNINELRTISDDSKVSPAISSIFLNVKNNKYWSSTSASASGGTTKDYAWIIDFTTSAEDFVGKSKTLYVRCVRDAN